MLAIRKVLDLEIRQNVSPHQHQVDFRTQQMRNRSTTGSIRIQDFHRGAQESKILAQEIINRTSVEFQNLINLEIAVMDDVDDHDYYFDLPLIFKNNFLHFWAWASFFYLLVCTRNIYIYLLCFPKKAWLIEILVKRCWLFLIPIY